jgi:hypothetical protein
MVLALAVEFENLGNTPAAVNEWSMTSLVPRDAPGGLLLPSKVTSLARLPGLDSVARGPSKRLLRLPAVGQIGQRSRKRLQVLDLIGPVDLEDRWRGRERELENFWAHAKAFFWSKVYLSFSGNYSDVFGQVHTIQWCWGFRGETGSYWPEDCSDLLPLVEGAKSGNEPKSED